MFGVVAEAVLFKHSITLSSAELYRYIVWRSINDVYWYAARNVKGAGPMLL